MYIDQISAKSLSPNHYSKEFDIGPYSLRDSRTKKKNLSHVFQFGLHKGNVILSTKLKTGSQFADA